MGILLGHLYNCWQFRDSLNGVSSQPFGIAAPAYEAGNFTGNALRCDGTIASTGQAIGSDTFRMADDWVGAVWFKPVTMPTPKPAVIVSNANTAIAGFRLRLAGSGVLDFNIIDNVGQNVAVQSAPVSVGNWHLAIFGHNKATAKGFLRVDDVQTDFANSLTISQGVPANITVGNFPLLDSLVVLNGVISLLAFWSGRILTVAEMQSLWNGGAGLDYPFG